MREWLLMLIPFYSCFVLRDLSGISSVRHCIGWAKLPLSDLHGAL